MKSNKCIYLIGLPGCGKSTLGRQFSEYSGYTFIDTDDEIIKQENRTIEQIYTASGEMGFREIENRLIKKYASIEKSVICTGGGLPCFLGNIDIMNEQGITVFMDVSPEEIWRRIKDTDFSGRPIYQNKTPEEIQDRIQKAYLERRKFYSKASILLTSDQIKLEDLLRALEMM